jgi:hypothetical protein
MTQGWAMGEVIEFIIDYIDLEVIIKPISRHEWRISGKQTRHHSTFNVNDYVSYTQAYFVVLQQSIIIAMYAKMHIQMLCSMHLKKSEDWIAREHRANFNSWLCNQMMDKGQGVEMVDKYNTNDIPLLMLANRSSTTIHTYKSYDINDYTFYTRPLYNKSANQNGGARIDAYDYHQFRIC